VTPGTGDSGTDLLVSECRLCHHRFLPHPGRCTRCGSTDLGPHRLPPVATVLAATELLAPSAGWPAPHRLALAELDGNVRLLGIVRGELPIRGKRMRVERDGESYFLRPGE
jgi:uncharacterized OB-fold protein